MRTFREFTFQVAMRTLSSGGPIWPGRSRRSRRRHHDDLEELGETPVRQAGAGGTGRSPAPEPLLQAGPIADLAFVPA
jgi:hypothetical protein